jgi:hypothetical protein
MNESNYVTDTAFSRMDSVRVAYIASSSPSPTVQFAANMQGAERQQERTIVMRIDPTADAIFLSTYSVENILARHYDAKDKAKAEALRAFVRKHWGTSPRQMALLCQHYPNDTWSCADSTHVMRYEGEKIVSTTVFGVVAGRGRGGRGGRGASPSKSVQRGTDAVLNGRTCEFLQQYYQSNPRYRQRADSLRREIAAWRNGTRK